MTCSTNAIYFPELSDIWMRLGKSPVAKELAPRFSANKYMWEPYKQNCTYNMPPQEHFSLIQFFNCAKYNFDFIY